MLQSATARHTARPALPALLSRLSHGSIALDADAGINNLFVKVVLMVEDEFHEGFLLAHHQ